MSAVGPSISTNLDILGDNASVQPAPSVNDVDPGSCSTDFMHTCPVFHVVNRFGCVLAAVWRLLTVLWRVACAGCSVECY